MAALGQQKLIKTPFPEQMQTRAMLMYNWLATDELPVILNVMRK